MTDEQPAPIRRKMFVKSNPQAKLPPERLQRQNLITHLAYTVMGDPAEAIRFLNESSPSLGGRPIDIATTSADGYSSVEQAIRQLAEPRSGNRP